MGQYSISMQVRYRKKVIPVVVTSWYSTVRSDALWPAPPSRRPFPRLFFALSSPIVV